MKFQPQSSYNRRFFYPGFYCSRKSLFLLSFGSFYRPISLFVFIDRICTHWYKLLLLMFLDPEPIQNFYLAILKCKTNSC